MDERAIREAIGRVEPDRVPRDIFYLSADPLPCRRANYTIPGHRESTLDEADAFLSSRLESLGYTVDREGVRVQAFRCEQSKPKSSWYAAPYDNDPFYTACNLTIELTGREQPDEIILACAHKDSQSWVASPGAYDNAVGTAALLEIARILAGQRLRRTLRLLWCNEEHRPWTSVTAAEQAKARGDDLVAVINVDGIGGRPPEWVEAGRRTNTTLYTEPEGLPLAELVSEANERYGIGLEQSVQQRKSPGDDDGSFVKAGYPAAICNIGSYPYRHEFYHDERDTAEDVDIPNVAMATQLTLASILGIDRG